MSIYRVNMVAVASTSIEVEAETEDEAFEMAFDQAPSANVTMDFDLGDWTTSGELCPEHSKPEDDIEKVD